MFITTAIPAITPYFNIIQHDIIQFLLLKTLLKNYSEEFSKQLDLHNRNLKNVLIYFEDQRNIIICKKTLQNFLKVSGLKMDKS